MDQGKLKVARVSTVTFFLDHQLKHQLKDHIDASLDITAIASSDGNWLGLESVHNLKCIQLDIARAPAPVKDLISTYKLYKLFKSKRFDIVHSTTPKAGLLCALAGFLAKVPVRIHTFTGQTWATKSGSARWLLRMLDKVIVILNTQCYADSFSQRDFLINENIGNSEDIKTLGHGSLAGVDLLRFNSTVITGEHKLNLKKSLNIARDDFVILFVGRLSKEKGIYELKEAFSKLSLDKKNVRLILLGPCEELAVEDILNDWVKSPDIDYVGQTDCPEEYMAIADLLCLPSYREGFGTVVIEAAAMKVPTLGTSITGLEDAVVDGETGILVPPKNSEKLYENLRLLVDEKQRCEKLGQTAYERCIHDFDSKQMSKLVLKEYKTLLADKQK